MVFESCYQSLYYRFLTFIAINYSWLISLLKSLHKRRETPIVLSPASLMDSLGQRRQSCRKISQLKYEKIVHTIYASYYFYSSDHHCPSTKTPNAIIGVPQYHDQEVYFRSNYIRSTRMYSLVVVQIVPHYLQTKLYKFTELLHVRKM